jgi:flagellar secretion chaperone FliS
LESNAFMFAPATSQRSSSSLGFAGTYRQIGVQTGVSGASPHQLVLMLYDGYNDSVNDARAAMKAGQMEAKGKAIGRALRIVDEGLKASLDVKAGGAMAENMMAVYAYVLRRLSEANLSNDAQLLDECLRVMEPLRSAWVAIRPESPASASAPVSNITPNVQ